MISNNENFNFLGLCREISTWDVQNCLHNSHSDCPIFVATSCTSSRSCKNSDISEVIILSAKVCFVADKVQLFLNESELFLFVTISVLGS